MKQVHQLVQGSDEWHAFRSTHFGASEAAAMLGLSKHLSRSDLLKSKATGFSKQVSDFVQERIFDHGHAVEALARPIIEDIIEDELYPATYSDGDLSASCDGVTISNSIAFEHKQWAEKLAIAVVEDNLPEEHMPQCQQVLMITGAKRLIFVVSDGTEQKIVYTHVEPDQAWFDRLTAGWAQFKKDLANYKHVEVEDVPVADAIDGLPKLLITVRGEVSTSNLPAFGDAATAFLAGIDVKPTTDLGFVNSKETAKFCRETVVKLDATKENMLAQTVTIGEAVDIIDRLKEKFRLKALELEKAVEKETERRRVAIIEEGKRKFAAHIASISIPQVTIIPKQPDFIKAMKGKSSTKGWQDAVDAELANAIIAADKLAEDLKQKVEWYESGVGDNSLLFPDLQLIITKPLEDFRLLVTSRIAHHEANLKAKEDAKKAAEAVQVVQAVVPVKPVSSGKSVKRTPENKEVIAAIQAAFDVTYGTACDYILTVAESISRSA